MYQLSLALAVVGVGLVLWFRPVFGLVVVQRYRGPSPSVRGQTRRERVVWSVARLCIILGTTVAVWTILWYG